MERPSETTSSSSVLLQGDEKFYNRVISRDSSVSSSVSSRVFYSRAAAEGGVPFIWETQPGTPKNDNPKDERIPPIGLPPAVLGLSLPKPPSVISDGTKDGGGGGFNVGKFKLLWKFFVGKGRSMKRRRRCGLHQPQVLV